MTQALIANMLGARRVGVSEAASKLQAANYATMSAAKSLSQTASSSSAWSASAIALSRRNPIVPGSWTLNRRRQRSCRKALPGAKLKS